MFLGSQAAFLNAAGSFQYSPSGSSAGKPTLHGWVEVFPKHRYDTLCNTCVGPKPDKATLLLFF